LTKATSGLRSSLFLGAALSSLAVLSPAGAQQAVAPETVVVTGSRIPLTSNLTSVSPIQTVTNQQFQTKGATDVSQMINDLPQTFVSNTSDFTNTNNPLSGPGGVTTVNLRGLGPTRTLVLVNGRRLGLGDPNTGNPSAAPDLDQIPVPLIERVEVLTGGASSTYGSDAVAGVVNFVMKQDFQGVQIDAQYGANWHHNSNNFARRVIAQTLDANTQGPLAQAPEDVWDGRTIQASITVGANSADGIGNVTAFLGYRNADPVWMKNRDFSACQINIEDTDPTLTDRFSGAYCSGSSNSNYFQPKTLAAQPVYSIVGNNAVLSPAAGSNPPASFNSNDYETLARQDTRFSGAVMAHYDLTDWAKPYTEFEFMNDRSFQQVAPTAVFRGANAFSADGSGNWFVNCDNPLLSASEVTAFCTGQGLGATDNAPLEIGRRNVEGGGRTSDYEHTNFRGVVGVKGDITNAWHYDAFGSYYYVTVDQTAGNYISNQKINNALQVVSVGGVPTCKSVLSGQDAACVPYNIFAEGGVTPEQIAYLATYGTSRGHLFEEILELDITGDLGSYGIRSPFANDGVQIAIGASNRKDKMVYAGDVAENSNDLVGFGGAVVPIDAAISVTEGYGEIRIPLAQRQPMAEDLSIDAGIRFSRYTSGHNPTTWKVGMQWAPIGDVRFRTSYDVAIRAPSILETYTPQSVTNTSIVSVDPCAPTTDNGFQAATATLEQCQRTGVTPAQYGNGGTTNAIGQCPSGQCAILTGGNEQLGPEKAKTFSVGMTLTPANFPGLTASVDYYKIDVTNGIIQGIPIDISLNNCLNTGDPKYCSLIKRTSAGTLYGTTVAGGGYIIGANVNSGFFNNSGLDFQTDYQTGLDTFGLEGWGDIGFHLTGTYTVTSKNQPVSTEPVYDCAGLFGNTCGSPLPAWRHHFRVNWDTPWNLMFAVTWRHMGPTEYEDNQISQPALYGGGIDRFNARIPGTNYIDLAATWQMTNELQIRAGMNNLFDTDPYIVSNLITGTGTPNTYNNYDLLGRQVFVAVTAAL
jgi:outer membrane receptor protein involved in Fe transport